jgi:hypothetical protein
LNARFARNSGGRAAPNRTSTLASASAGRSHPSQLRSDKPLLNLALSTTPGTPATPTFINLLNHCFLARHPRPRA